MIERVNAYFQQHKQTHLEELKQFLRIPSVSAVSEHREDMARCAEWLAAALGEAGLEHVAVMPTDGGHPVVYADWLHAEGRPTVLIYGHYDVQPADPLELWTTPPFAPEIRDGKLYARGSTDDKGQLLLHVKAVEAFLRTAGSLPVNVKFCIEGEEEIASRHLPAFVEQHRELLAADIVTLSDTSLHGPDQPALMYGLRGLAGVELVVEGAGSDLHSGLYGGGVPNPLHALAQLLATFHDADGRVAVDGFYDGVLELSEREREAFRQIEPEESRLLGELGLDALYGEAGYSYLERTTARPTLEITSLSGGFQGEGIKPIIPRQASAKIACRLVAAQSPERVMEALEAHVRRHAPAAVRVELKRLLAGNPFLTPINHPTMVAAAAAYAEEYGVEPVYLRSGGSIPIVEVLGRVLAAPVVMLGFGLPGENLHAPDEHFHLRNWDKGLSTISRYWLKLAEG